MRYAILISTFLGLLVPLFSHGQESRFRFSRIDINQGLSNNEVNCIYKDKNGFLWFGTRSGLNRYDGYKFKIFRHKQSDSTSLADEEVSQIFEGPENTLWMNTKSTPSSYNLLTEKFNQHPQHYLSSIGIEEQSLQSIKKAADGSYWFLGVSKGLFRLAAGSAKAECIIKNESAKFNVTDFVFAGSEIWLIKSNGQLQRINAVTGATTALFTFNAQPQNTDCVYQLYKDNQGDLWVCSPGIGQGVFYINATTGAIKHITKASSPQGLNNNLVKAISQDTEGLIWLATDHGGVNLLDKKDFSIKYLLNQEDDDYSLSQNSINSMLIDDAGVVWIGTYKKGISYYHKSISKFPVFRHSIFNSASLPYNDVNRFAEDAKGNIWIGTNGGGLACLNRKTGMFTHYLHDPVNNNSLSNDVIVSLFIDHNEVLWIGTYFGGLDRFDGKTFKHYRHNSNDPSSIADNAIWSIMEDSLHRLWVGTFSQGLDRLDVSADTFTHFKPTGYHSVHSGYVCNLLQAKDGNIWIATSNGIDVINKHTGDFANYYVHNPAKPTTTLSNNNCISLLEDSRNLIWVTTRDGLNYFDPKKGVFTCLRKENGLPDNIILSLVEDEQHNLWAGTTNGLSNIIVSRDAKTGAYSFQFKNYNESDGLQGKEFNEYSALSCADGHLIFGGANGFNYFTPAEINNRAVNPKLVFTDLQMFNKSVNVGEKLNGHIILQSSISETQNITLHYDENFFSIEFAALNFFNVSHLRYAYTLEGFNKQWFVADDVTPKATYTNLDPGSYTFKVTTIDENGNRNKYHIALAITILPPLWRTPLAYVFYVLILAAIFYLIHRIGLQRTRARFALEQERKEAQQVHELDMMKIRFFTNLSHEFRTPLSLIMAPLEKFLKENSDAGKKGQLQMIYRNARRLVNLVNQLLDFRKMEMQELRLNNAKGDIIKFVADVSNSFTDLAAQRHIHFSVQVPETGFVTLFDHDKVERILFNLLSNAFKFTPGDGNVSVVVEINNIGNVEIKVCDTGIGIPPDKKQKIFERFFQDSLPANLINQGSGIGLAIAKEFAKLHGGNISVESEVEKGSCFTVTLPLIQQPETFNEPSEQISETIVLPQLSAGTVETATEHVTNGNGLSAKPSVLIVEDSEDLLSYLKDNLKEYFTVVEASNGKTGWQRALAAHPQLIISDVNMPEMSGIELCRKIKADKRTSHIPVILLTALSSEQMQIQGLETGANDYVTKPFNFEILLSKVRNLLSLQESSKRTYQKQFKAGLPEVKIDSPDGKFMQDLLLLAEKNMANADFSVEEMSRQLHLSRVGLYKKMMTLTGKTPLEFIRDLRMERAAQLLQKSNLTIAEVAYEVGFNDPKYFSKFFKNHFKILPSAYQATNKEDKIYSPQDSNNP